MKMTLTVLSALLLLTNCALANSAQTATAEAPPLLNAQVTGSRELGTWDDVYVGEEQDFIIVRRGAQLFSLSMTAATPPRPLVSLPVLKDSHIVAGTGWGGRQWLFVESKAVDPFAIEIGSGAVSHFPIPRANKATARGASIQSRVIVRHTDAVLLELSGGPAWPRIENRPIYYWMSLNTGKAMAFPTGWDLIYFSTDQRVAVFGTTMQKNRSGPEVQAIDMRTGRAMAKSAALQDEEYSLFHWEDTQAIQPIYRRRLQNMEQDYLKGISLHGSTYPVSLNAGLSYLSTAKASDGFAGFRVRKEMDPERRFLPLWIMRLLPREQPQLVATRVTDFAMLDGGNCLYVTGGHGRKGEFSEAFFREHAESAAWNLLDHVERLPELDQQFVDKDYIGDKLSVRLVESFGSRRGAITLCLFQHDRLDWRALRDFDDPSKTLEEARWKRALIVTSTGQRYMSELFHEGNLPDRIWLHRSGKVVTGTDEWTTVGTSRERKIQLTETTLKL